MPDTLGLRRLTAAALEPLVVQSALWLGVISTVSPGFTANWPLASAAAGLPLIDTVIVKGGGALSLPPPPHATKPAASVAAQASEIKSLILFLELLWKARRDPPANAGSKDTNSFLKKQH